VIMYAHIYNDIDSLPGIYEVDIMVFIGHKKNL